MKSYLITVDSNVEDLTITTAGSTRWELPWPIGDAAMISSKVGFVLTGLNISDHTLNVQGKGKQGYTIHIGVQSDQSDFRITINNKSEGSTTVSTTEDQGTVPGKTSAAVVIHFPK